MTNLTVSRAGATSMIITSAAGLTTIAMQSPGIQGVPGRSAYQSWLALGNVGTEADFIASLGGAGGAVDWVDVTGKPTFGTASTADTATLLARANHTGTQAIATVTGLQTALDGKQPITAVLTATTASYTVAEQTKLAAIAAGATANSPDATLLARANHTGTQAIATVTGLQAALDGKQPITAVLTATTASYTVAEQTKLAAIAAGATANSPDATLLARANHTGTQAIATVTGLQTALDGKSAIGHGHVSTDITDSTAAGRTILTAATAADQRTALQTPSIGLSIALAGGIPNF